MKFNELMKKLREDRNLTQQQAAELGYQLTQYKTGKRIQNLNMQCLRIFLIYIMLI